MAKIDKDYQSENENPNPINIPLVIQSQLPDTMDTDGLSQHPNTPLYPTSIEVVLTSLEFHLNFD